MMSAQNTPSPQSGSNPLRSWPPPNISHSDMATAELLIKAQQQNHDNFYIWNRRQMASQKIGSRPNGRQRSNA